MDDRLQTGQPALSDGYIPVGNSALFYRAIGHGPPTLVLHGGPDFDHTYVLPDLDRLADSLRLIYYDQRGRGKSAANVQPDDVTIQSDIQDIERVRAYFGLPSVVVLGHSWGGLLALEYAIRHPQRVSHLILLNTAPASHDDYLLLRQAFRVNRPAADREALQAWSTSAEYAAGDPDTVAAYYRVHFRMTIEQPEHLERVIRRLRASFTRAGILKARAIEARLYDQTWLLSDYNLLPKLKQLNIPALVLHGEYDFVPVACAAHIAAAMPGARCVLLSECGHFSYIERPDDVRHEIARFL
jgi:proline iminopeptidase